MRFSERLEKFRIRSGSYATSTGDDYGAFIVPGPFNCDLRVIASPGDANENIPWEHVSVSLPNRCPNWPEMEHVKRSFFLPQETAMQLHVPVSEHLSLHPHCLHIWRPNDGRAIPMPPASFVAPVKTEAVA